ncbi:MAG: selenite/tellurite reduction operon b-type cytochrome iron-sulfur cluster-binding subunit ExtO [Desulfuromonadales bacterium]
MARWIAALSALCLLGLSLGGAAVADPTTIRLSGAHAGLRCADCHEPGESAFVRDGARECADCHDGYQGIFAQAMTTRSAEKAFVHGAFGGHDTDFFQKNCADCHVSSCADCHGGDIHTLARPTSDTCHRCHQGYFVGADFFGRAPRENHNRYQRGEIVDGQAYLKMRPDVHEEAGLSCGDCHSMQSLVDGRLSAKGCTDCHEPDPAIVEHRIAAHREQLECTACHASWAPQEYGSFFLRLGDNPNREYFNLKQNPAAEYVQSAYLRQQNAPPLGLNGRGKISPIRPQFIAFYSDLRRKDDPNRVENALVAAQWKAFFPHTIRRGTATCEACHDNPRRFLLEDPRDRIYELQRDGLPLPSFWSQEGQTLVNGQFMPKERYERLSTPTSTYTKAYVEKWKNLVENVDTSSKP